MKISEEAVEAAARAVVQSLWNNDGHDYGLYIDFGNELTGIVDGEVNALVLARAALEAAAPLLMAQAWDEGRAHGAVWPYGHRGLATDDNPYRP